MKKKIKKVRIITYLNENTNKYLCIKYKIKLRSYR